METMIVADLKQMNPKNIVRVRNGPVLETFSHAIMEIVFLASIFATVTMTVSTILMKI
jgi:hypothetical protein